MRLPSWVMEFFLLPLVALVLREARLVHGRENASIFLWGSILWTATIENPAVMMGGCDSFACANTFSIGNFLLLGVRRDMRRNRDTGPKGL